jgi:prophage tail gpP-like protein
MKLWQPGQRIKIISEPHGIDATYFLMARKFTRSRMDGTRTALTLKEDGIWLAGAHPHKKHKATKSAEPLQIIVG